MSIQCIQQTIKFTFLAQSQSNLTPSPSLPPPRPLTQIPNPLHSHLPHPNVLAFEGDFSKRNWDAKGVILLDILPQGQCINAARYCSTLGRLKEAIRRKRPGLLRRGVVLQHDNATPHSANLTQQWLQRYGWKFFLILPTVQTWHLLTSFVWTLVAPFRRHGFRDRR
ncbi:histone-lysine N-methyltransferase SETMAR [Plakobranchus ocellatus]|uniref:Histone-lysine N-methyltransferase SETMAR n=1 Tax=Plakobranchus ocellatus TaxID=259542 RepID=A0AAV4ABU9_9GAST|nr:histone-lysine N-methyltransferase SETMAR [Plakobranchus ocellatus]